MKNIKIRTKLLLSFILIVLMVLAIGWVSFSQMNSAWNNTKNLYDHPYQVNLAVRDIHTGITAMRLSLKDLILAGSETERQKFMNRIDQEEKAVYRNFDLIYSQYLGEKSAIDSAFSAFSEWKGIRDSTISLCMDGKTKEAAYWSTHSGESYSYLLIKKMDNLEEFAMQKAADFYSAVEQSKNKLQLHLWLIVGLFFFLTILIGYILLKSVTLPLRELILSADAHRLGNYSVRCNILMSNEFGQVADSFNRMADSIESEIMVKTGITRISDSMLGKEDMPEFLRSLMGELLAQTKSNSGAIYFLDEDTSAFEPKFSIGMDQSKLRSFSAKTFEGEFGLTLLEKKITCIRDIPEDTIFNFPTVTGLFKPREILTIPIFLDDKVVAIISLAGLYPFSATTMEMLEIAEKNLTAGINGIVSLQKIREFSVKLDQQNTELELQSKEMRLQAEELQEQNSELEMQKRQIDEASRLKSEFLSSMSHELRTPLNAVIALSGVLNRKLQNKIPDDEYSYLEIIERNGKHLLAMINEILDLSRIESGKAEIKLSNFSLHEEVGAILDALQLQIGQKNIQAKNQVEPNFPMIYSDRSKCHHILQNLIGNSVKFTDQGSIDISARIIGEEFHIHVKDTGIGIHKDQISQIFDKFHQVDGTSSRKHEGTGLGLAIAEKYSQMLGARIEVSSEPDKGSVFTLILPKFYSESSVTSARSYNHYPSLPDHSLDKVYEEVPSGPKTILVIEDSEPSIIQLSEILQEQGYLCNIARNGSEALNLVKLRIPDAVVLDLMMPGMDGFEVLEQIRSTEATSKIPVLILTAKYLSASELNRLTANNIHQLIQKGDIGKDELLHCIQTMVGERKEPGKQLPKKAIPIVKEGMLNILLVEDNEDNVKTIQVLMADKHHLLIARDGQEGIKMAKIVKPDLILLDISLPKKDGFTVLQEIREVDYLMQVPVIAVTARAMKGDREHFLNYGFDDYLSKPIDIHVLEETLGKWILGLPVI